ncbi:partial putative ketoamine kinase, partial [Rhodocyclaceae bacterium]
MPDFAPVAAAIAEATGTPFAVGATRAAGGGSIHSAWVLADGGRRYFVKLNETGALPMFAAEAEGLAALDAAGAVRVPAVVASGLAPGYAYLVLEHLEMGALDRASGAALGRALAALHRHTGPHFGWQRDNFIGATPQENRPTAGWGAFYSRQRLLPQLRLARANGMERKLVEQGENLAEKTAAFFVDGDPAASLLHGDLWSGNAARLADGTPTVFDPAVHYGDREADVAMAELFGGFPESFYAAYR